MSEHPDKSDDEMIDDPNTEVMTAYVAEPEADYEDYDEFGDDSSLPGRPRRVLVNRYSVALVIVLVGAGCFYGGVRVEKAKVSSSGTSGLSGLASRFSALRGGAASTSGASSRGGAAGASGFSGRFGGAPGGFAGAPGGAGAGTEGTIASINGDAIYITEASGNTVKVQLNSATTLKKTVTVGKRSLYPGDTVSVTGNTGSSGSVTATSLTDSGASSTGTSSSTGSSSSSGSSTSSGASGLSSLFGGS